MVTSIIEGIRNYLADCPLLNEIAPENRHIDRTDPDTDNNYGALTGGNIPCGEPYINGSQEMMYTAQISIRKLSDSDIKRLENNAFIERLQMWLFIQAKNGNLPEMPENCVPVEINAPNAMLFDTDVTGKKSTYAVQLALKYILIIN